MVKGIVMLFRQKYFYIKDLILGTSKKWDDMSVSQNEAVQFAHKYMNPEPSPRRGQDSSPEYVLAHYGQLINWQLRKDEITDDCRRVSEVISKCTTKIPIVAYRGVNDNVYQKMKEAAKGLPGIDFYEKGFLCASLVKGFESKGYINIRIYIPEGSNAIYLGNVNDEEEVYYPIGIQCGARLKIISCDDKYVNCYLIKTDGISDTTPTDNLKT